MTTTGFSKPYWVNIVFPNWWSLSPLDNQWNTEGWPALSYQWLYSLFVLSFLVIVSLNWTSYSFWIRKWQVSVCHWDTWPHGGVSLCESVKHILIGYNVWNCSFVWMIYFVWIAMSERETAGMRCGLAASVLFGHIDFQSAQPSREYGSGT